MRAPAAVASKPQLGAPLDGALGHVEVADRDLLRARLLRLRHARADRDDERDEAEDESDDAEAEARLRDRGDLLFAHPRQRDRRRRVDRAVRVAVLVRLVGLVGGLLGLERLERLDGALALKLSVRAALPRDVVVLGAGEDQRVRGELLLEGDHAGGRRDVVGERLGVVVLQRLRQRDEHVVLVRRDRLADVGGVMGGAG